MKSLRPTSVCLALLGIAGPFAAGGCDIRDEVPRPVVRQPLLGDMPAGGAARRRLAGGAGIEYVGGYAAGLGRARAERKPMLLVFRAEWCRFSAELAQRTLADPRLVAVSRRIICVLVDADRDAATCRDFGVPAFPTVVVVLPDGSESFRATGLASVEKLTAAIEQAVPAARVAGGEEPVVR